MSELHKTVLLDEAIAGLNIESSGIYIDATFGRGGHSRAILQKLGSAGQLMAMDKDPSAIKIAQQEFLGDPRFCSIHDSFAAMKQAVLSRGWLGKINGILLDLGVSSPQLDNPQRGFSFRYDGPLDMRMNREQSLDAATWLNQASPDEICRVLRVYGEERFARRIAQHIADYREQQLITTTGQLSDIISRAIPRHEKHKHPATRSFQAIRIFINRELEELTLCLEQTLETLAVGGRLCVISFHSLEDRIVKQFIQSYIKGNSLPPDLPIKDADIQNRHFRKIGKLIRPSQSEIATNPRARSARLRIAEKFQ